MHNFVDAVHLFLKYILKALSHDKIIILINLSLVEKSWMKTNNYIDIKQVSR